MKVVKNLLFFVCIVASVVFLNNTKCFATEVQYTDDLIPVMASSTSPEGTASASSIWSGTYEAWKAFDNSTSSSSAWATETNILTGWLEYDFTNPKCITKYTLAERPGGSLNEMPKDWTFEAWDEQSGTWIILDTQLNRKDWTVKQAFTFKNSKFYEKYRINVIANCGFKDFTAIGEMEMMETLSVPETSKLKVVLEPKETLQLSVDEDLAENTKMTWTSSDSTVATVDANGVVVAINPGNTIITSKNQDGTFEESTNVLVVEDAKEYRLAVDLKIGQSCRLTVDDYTFTRPVTWSVMDPAIATISSKGKVTAISDGLTVATATDNQGKIVGQIYIRVRR